MEGNDEFIVVPAMPVSAEDNENNGDEPILSAVLVTEVSTENVNDRILFRQEPLQSASAGLSVSVDDANGGIVEHANVPPYCPPPSAPPAFVPQQPVPFSPINSQLSTGGGLKTANRFEQQQEQHLAGYSHHQPGTEGSHEDQHPIRYDSPKHVSRVKNVLTREKQFWGAPLYSDTVSVEQIFRFLNSKNLCPDDANTCMLICKHLIRNDFLHVYGSYNIEEVEVLQMSTKLKIGRRYIIPMEDFCIGGDGILKEGTNTNHMQSNEGQSVPPEGEGIQRKDSQDCKPKRISTIPSNDSVEGLVSNIASTLHVKQDSSLNLFDRLARASRRILVSAPSDKQLASILKTAIASSIFQKYPQIPIAELQLHDIFAIDRTMREREKPLEKGVVAKKNKVMNKEIYHPGLRSSYAPSAFRALRQLFNISEDFYANSLMEQDLQILNNGGGSSGAMFLRSQDKHFIIKGVTKSETRILRSILPQYIEHCQKYPDTLLPRIYSLLKLVGVRPQDIQRIIVCNNVFDTLLTVDTSFDLKGSTSNRYVTLESRIEHEKNTVKTNYRP